MTERLSEPVRLFLREHMVSFERLEVLMLLSRNETQEWSAKQVSKQLNMPLELGSDALAGLETSGLVQRSSDALVFRFAPATPALAAAVAELSDIYREHSAAVMSAMSMDAIERIRSGPMRAFADAFMLGKRKDDG
jgi:hypothetical protein